MVDPGDPSPLDDVPWLPSAHHLGGHTTLDWFTVGGAGKPRQKSEVHVLGGAKNMCIYCIYIYIYCHIILNISS